MENPYEYSLVIKAFEMACDTVSDSFVGGYVEWSTKWREIAERDLADLQLTASGVRDLVLIHFQSDVPIKQVRETEPGRERSCYYTMTLPMDHVPRGVYVKMTLFDEDPENPVVHIVRAHRKGV